MVKKSSKKQQKSVDMTAYQTNEKGEIIQWDRKSPFGKKLSALFDAAILTIETGMVVKEKYPEFRIFATRTLNSALQAERNRIEKEALLRANRGSDSK